jgi:hypothetical protein|tara:strand:- start:34 stop:234 length:201 start_codon:yes stop_codon:yes gene_type:complete
MSTLVKEVFTVIKANKLSLPSLSEKAGISYSSVRSWKRHEPQLGNFVSLVEAMGGKVTINWTGKKE